MLKKPQETSAQSSQNHITIIVCSSNIPQQIKFQYNRHKASEWNFEDEKKEWERKS